MTKNSKNNRHHKNVVNTKMKHCLSVLTTILIATSITIYCSLELAPSSVQAAMTAEPETQFKLDVAYAYVGEFTVNASYTDSNGFLMSRISQYPSTIVLNITRVPGVKIASCDAVIEVYRVQISTDTGIVENHVYNVGTNYSSFSEPELLSFIPHVNDLIKPSEYMSAKGGMYLNWTENQSILTPSIGSATIYSTLNSTSGLWSVGKPNEIFVTVDRIGYITMNDGLISAYKDAATKTATTAKLDNYENGFLHNTLVPAAELPQTTLFDPTAIIKLVS